MKKSFKNLIKFGTGWLILFFVFYKIGLSNIYDSLKLMNLWFLIPITLLFILTWIMNTINLMVLLKPLKYTISFWKMFKHYWMSQLASLVLPGSIGNFSIIVFLKDKELNVGRISAMLLMDKIITLICYLSFAVLGFVVLFDFGNLLFKTLVLFFLVVGLLTLILTKKIRLFIRKYILRKYAKHFTGFSDTFFNYFKRHKKAIFINVFWTVSRILTIGVVIFLIFLSLNSYINLWAIIVITCMESIIAMTSITPQGIGIKEPVGMYLYSLIGVPAPIAAARYIIIILEKYVLMFLIVFIKKIK
ncbi:MAG: flippase-like domain-containing protein [Nanoarchaeota archaeon]|nr:flippase-like domain-containing protein [Nanoarchaeota archaeon]